MPARRTQPRVEPVGPKGASPMLIPLENSTEPVLVDDEMAALFIVQDLGLVYLDDQSARLNGGVEVVRCDLGHEPVQVAVIVVRRRIEVIECGNHDGGAVFP